MNLKSLEIPESLSDTGAWLDDLLLSPDLVNTIVELEVLAGDRLTRVQSLDGVLAASEDAVYESGLANVSDSTIRSILRQPALLLELQQRVMMHGGDFWQKKTDANFGTAKATSMFDTASSGSNAATGPGNQAVPANRNKQASFAANGNRKMIFGTLAALAAAVLIMVSIGQFGGGSSSVAKAGWGFSKSGLLTSDVSEGEMLDRLVGATRSWHNKTPGSAGALAKRLHQFDDGCQALLASDLPQLSAATRRSVHQACENCRTSIAALLDSLERGTDLETVRTNAATAVDELATALQRLS